MKRLPLVFLHGALLVFAATTLLPFVWMITSSLKSQPDFFASLFLPQGNGWFGVAWDHVTLHNFRRLFTEFPIGRAMLNSWMMASVTGALATLACAMGGYALAKFSFAGRNAVTLSVLVALIIPGPLLIAPGYNSFGNWVCSTHTPD